MSLLVNIPTFCSSSISRSYLKKGVAKEEAVLILNISCVLETPLHGTKMLVRMTVEVNKVLVIS